jgi:DNA ligase-1
MSEVKIVELIHSFEPLVGKTKNGKWRDWEIRVEKFEDYSEIVTIHGYTNKIESRIRVNKGKNIGKINETTHFQQALLEATSKWKKKQETEKYIFKTNINQEEQVERKEDRENQVEKEEEQDNEKEKEEEQGKEFKPNPNSNPKLPMLAQDYQKQKKKLKYPCFIQPKLDGYRMIYDSNKKTMTTRQGKDFVIVKESGLLLEELERIPNGWILDGELYVHSDLSFENLGVLRKTKSLTESEKMNLQKIEYHIYDCIDSNKTFEERWDSLQVFQNQFQKIIIVETKKVFSENEILEIHPQFVQQGYEGSILRNKDGLYLEKNRSYDLLKLKDFMDAEFEIVGFTNELDTSGEDKNLIVWIIKIKEDITCKVRPKGNKEERQKLYEECVQDFSKYKGRKLWTKFFDYTSDGSLRFPSTKTETVDTYIRDEIV